MPTNRIPINRYRRARLSPEAVEAFRIGLRTAAQYLACIHGERKCGRTGPGTACLPCSQYIEAHRTLFRTLSLPPWHISPLDCWLDEPMPGYWASSGLCSAATWPEAQRLRRELLQAAGMDED